MENIYRPYLMEVVARKDEAPSIVTLRLKFRDPAEEAKFSFLTGQFAEYGVFGEGESTFCLASSPTQFEREKYIECTFRVVGRVTGALGRLNVGDTMGLRAPYGTHFPIEDWKGRDVVFATGGIALPPIRSVIWNLLDRKAEFGHITIVYGAKTVAELVYKDEIAQWEKMDGVTMISTVDPGGETPTWNGKVGYFPTILNEHLTALTAKGADLSNTVFAVCGPPVVIKITLRGLDGFNVPTDHIFTTLENRMKCGFGKCGRCNVGGVYVCREGPVFTATQVNSMLKDF